MNLIIQYEVGSFEYVDVQVRPAKYLDQDVSIPTGLRTGVV